MYLPKNKQQWFAKQKAKTVQAQLSELFYFGFFYFFKVIFKIRKFLSYFRGSQTQCFPDSESQTFDLIVASGD